MDFYSARLLHIILVADGVAKKRNHYDESVIVLRASDHDHAFERALEFGRNHETAYLNDKGQQVRWAFVKVLAVNWIGRKIDGSEVSSSLHYRTSAEPIAADHIFDPETSQL